MSRPRPAPGHGQGGIYVHVPFCSAICPYCDFAVLTGDADAHAAYVETLLAELAMMDPAPWSCDTLYLGGGTPSALEPGDLARIVRAIGGRFGKPAHITMEANPEDVTPDSVRAWRELGVAMLSLGVQSFADAELEFLGRRHDVAGARAAVSTACAAGFDTVSLDLIFGLPEQDVDRWRRNLETATALGPDHISCYQLTVTDSTLFGVRRRRGGLVELADEPQAELFELTHTWLAAAGYAAYEVSNFARSDAHRSAHNRKYWEHRPYLGLGPSAHSFRDRQRWWNERQLRDWQARVQSGESPVACREQLDDEQLALEALMLGLRTPAGVDMALFQQHHGVDLHDGNRDVVARGVAQGTLEVDGAFLRPTVRGLAVADALALSFRLDASR